MPTCVEIQQRWDALLVSLAVSLFMLIVVMSARSTSAMDPTATGAVSMTYQVALYWVTMLADFLRGRPKGEEAPTEDTRGEIAKILSNPISGLARTARELVSSAGRLWESAAPAAAEAAAAKPPHLALPAEERPDFTPEAVASDGAPAEERPDFTPEAVASLLNTPAGADKDFKTFLDKHFPEAAAPTPAAASPAAPAAPAPAAVAARSSSSGSLPPAAPAAAAARSSSSGPLPLVPPRLDLGGRRKRKTHRRKAKKSKKARRTRKKAPKKTRKAKKAKKARKSRRR